MPLPVEGPFALAREHDRSDFSCRSEEQTRWLRESARRAQDADTARVHVATLAGTSKVGAYYALSTTTIQRADATARLLKGVGGYPTIPGVLLSRLGVDTRIEGQGVGRFMLTEALKTTAAIAGLAGARALVIDAEDEDAKRFYLRHAEFDEFPTEPLKLYLVMDALRAALA